jgi:two-component system chemotaxis response regulator CheY
MRILVVDDEADVRDLLRVILEQAGYAITEAVDGLQAIQLYRKLAFDLILCDIFMPECDGLEVILKLRGEFPSVKIIAMSAGLERRSMDMLRVAKHFNVNDVLYKPFDQAKLLTVIAKTLQPKDGEEEKQPVNL